MPENGVIFSDGIEADRLDFNAGTEVEIGIAERRISPLHRKRQALDGLRSG